jgi:hypothetical protein
MSENTKPSSSQFYQYLRNIGLITDKDVNNLISKTTDLDDKKKLFEVSNILGSYTPADWFDISAALHYNWVKYENKWKENNASPASVSTAPNSTGLPLSSNLKMASLVVRPPRNDEHLVSKAGIPDSSVTARDLSSRTSPTIDKYYAYSARSPGQNLPPPIIEEEYSSKQSQEDKQLLKKAFDHNELSLYKSVVTNLFINVRKAIYKTIFRRIQNVTTGRKVYSRASSKERTDIKPITPGRNRPSQALTNNSGGQGSKPESRKNSSERQNEKKHYLKLYNDYFLQLEKKITKYEAKSQEEAQAYPFTPKIQPFEANSPEIVSNLKTPVFDRLIKTKPVDEQKRIWLSHEYQELKKATFQPDLSLTRKRENEDDSRFTSPEVMKEMAANRLYKDAKFKEKLLSLKQMQGYNDKLDGCTFSPKVLSPYKRGKKFSNGWVYKSADRLYLESARRNKKILKKQATIHEAELDGCTFAPEIYTQKYRERTSKSPVNFEGDTQVFERLYSGAQKKREQRSIYIQEIIEHDEKISPEYKMKQLSRSRSNPQYKGLKGHMSMEQGMGSDDENVAFDRLYNDLKKRNVKIDNLRKKVDKEQGATFKPKINKSYSLHTKNLKMSSIQTRPNEEDSACEPYQIESAKSSATKNKKIDNFKKKIIEFSPNGGNQISKSGKKPNNVYMPVDKYGSNSKPKENDDDYYFFDPEGIQQKNGNHYDE